MTTKKSLKPGFARRITALREAQGLSIESLAIRSGVAVNTLRTWENGKFVPRDERLIHLAQALETAPEYILTGYYPSPEENVSDAEEAEPESVLQPLTMGERLYHLRVLRAPGRGGKGSVEGLAKATGIIRSRLQAMERSEGNPPTLAEIEVLAQSLGVSASFLLLGDERSLENLTSYQIGRIWVLYGWVARQRETIQERAQSRRAAPKPPSNFAERIRSLRLEKKTAEGQSYTQKQIAQASGLREGTISSWETGNARPRLDSGNLAKIAKYFGTTPEYLITGIDPGKALREPTTSSVGGMEERTQQWKRWAVLPDRTRRVPVLDTPIQWDLTPMGDLVKRLRTRSDPERGFPMSKNQLAVKMKVDRSHIVPHEKPTFLAGERVLQRLANGLEVSLVYLLTGVDQEIDLAQSAVLKNVQTDAGAGESDETLGWRIARLMEEMEERLGRRVTQKVLAEKLGVQTVNVSKWLNDLYLPQRKNLEKMAELFGTTSEYILYGESGAPTFSGAQVAEDEEAAQSLSTGGIFGNEKVLRETLEVLGIPGEGREAKSKLLRFLIREAGKKKMITRHLRALLADVREHRI